MSRLAEGADTTPGNSQDTPQRVAPRAVQEGGPSLADLGADSERTSATCSTTADWVVCSGSPVHVVDVSDDRRWLLVGSVGLACLWDIRRRALVHTFALSGLASSGRHPPGEECVAVAFLSGDRVITVGATSCRIWLTRDGVLLNEVALPGTEFDVADVGDVCLSNDGGMLAHVVGPSGAVGGEYSSVHVVDTLTGVELCSITNKTMLGFRYGDMGAVAFSPDGLQVAVGSEEGLQLWSVQGKRIRNLRHNGEPWAKRARGIRFSSDGSRLLVLDQEALRVWSIRHDVLELLVADGEPASPRSFCWLTDGSIVWASRDGSLWCQEEQDAYVLFRPNGAIRQCECLFQRGYYLVAGFASGHVYVWNVVALKREARSMRRKM